jgi:PQQ-like domain
MFDRTTKVLLALIAIALWLQLLRAWFVPFPTRAQTQAGTEAPIPVTMTAAGGMVYVATGDGMLYGYAAADLAKRLEKRIGEK